MQVVNAGFGHQVGFAEIDESTLVVDLMMTCFPLLNIVLEISRPLAIWSYKPIECTPEFCDAKPWSITLPNGMMIPYTGL